MAWLEGGDFVFSKSVGEVFGGWGRYIGKRRVWRGGEVRLRIVGGLEVG